MKKSILTILIIFSFSSLANAQFNKGAVLAGGGLSYSDNTNSVENLTTQTSNSGSINLSLGKATKENTVIGVNLLYSANKQGNDVTIGNGSYYGIGLFYRKYKSLGKDFYLFGEAGAGYNYSDLKATDTTNHLKLIQSSFTIPLYVTPGIAYRVSKILFMEISLNQVLSFQYYNTESHNGASPQVNSKSCGFTISTSLNPQLLSQLAIGFRLML